MKSRTSFNLLRGLALMSFMAAGPFLFSLDSAAAWERAADMGKRSKDYVPGSMRTETVEYGKKGEVASREESLNALVYDSSGQVESRIVWARKDGKDVTEEKRAEYEKARAKADGKKGKPKDNENFSMSLPDPLNPPEGATVKRGTPASVKDGGRDYWDFPFEYKQKGIFDYQGSLRIDAASGMPVSMDYKLKPLPIGVRYAEFAISFEPFGEGAFVATAMKIGFDAKLIIFEKKMDMAVTMQEYSARAGAK
jgi:hypothetical protein